MSVPNPPQTRPPLRPPGLGSGARVAIFAAAAALLVGVALAAGGLGPWVARPISGPGRLPERPPTLQTRPTMSAQPTAPAQDSASGNAVGWGLRIVVIAVLAVLVILAGRWIYGRFRDLAVRQSVGGGADMVSGLAGLQQPPPVLAGEAGRHFDPRQAADAIISCWLWVERAAAATGSPRREQDTPTEFLQRFVEQRDGVGADAAAELLPLYQRARFDHVALTPDAATSARAAAEVLCAPVRRAGGFADESATTGPEGTS